MDRLQCTETPMKKKIHIIIDCGMVILLPLLMAYSLIGEAAHEYLGIAMFLLFIAHHIMNAAWWRNLFRGKYSPVRIVMTVTNLLLVIIMVALPVICSDVVSCRLTRANGCAGNQENSLAEIFKVCRRGYISDGCHDSCLRSVRIYTQTIGGLSVFESAVRVLSFR